LGSPSFASFPFSDPIAITSELSPVLSSPPIGLCNRHTRPA
jgi:hypothetical protein